MHQMHKTAVASNSHVSTCTNRDDFSYSCQYFHGEKNNIQILFSFSDTVNSIFVSKVLSCLRKRRSKATGKPFLQRTETDENVHTQEKLKIMNYFLWCIKIMNYYYYKIVVKLSLLHVFDSCCEIEVYFILLRL